MSSWVESERATKTIYILNLLAEYLPLLPFLLPPLSTFLLFRTHPGRRRILGSARAKYVRLRRIHFNLIKFWTFSRKSCSSTVAQAAPPAVPLSCCPLCPTPGLLHTQLDSCSKLAAESPPMPAFAFGLSPSLFRSLASVPLLHSVLNSIRIFCCSLSSLSFHSLSFSLALALPTTFCCIS